MKTGIIFSCYNIENKLDSPKLIQLLSNSEEYHFCFVNDCSNDNTTKILNSIIQKVPHRTSIINLEKKSGKSESLRAGVNHLQKLSFINYIGFFNDIIDYDFESLEVMIEMLHSNENTSIVFGLEKKPNSFNKKEKHAILNLFLKRCPFGKEMEGYLKLKDSTMVFSKSIAPILFDKQFLSNHFFYLEILLRLKSIFGQNNSKKFIQTKELKLVQPLGKPYSGFYQSINYSFLLIFFCINYRLFRNGYLLVR